MGAGAYVTIVGAAALVLSCAPKRQPATAASPSPDDFIATAVDLDPQDVYVRIVDVGPGLCAVIRAPGDHFMVYDAGHLAGSALHRRRT